MALGKRITRLAKAHWNDLLERVETIIREEEAESAARRTASEELNRSMQPSFEGGAPAAPQTVPQKPAQQTELQRAYRVLGLSDDADLAAVRRAYRELMGRSDPNRFPEGSPERQKAAQIQQRIEQAYQTLLLHLDHSAQRFRNLSVE